MIFGWLRERRRREILEDPFPEDWIPILERNMAHWAYLDDDEKSRLRDLLQVFLSEKNWEGCGGLELNDEIRVTISAQACLLLLGHEDHDLYRRVKSILVYPSTVVTPSTPSQWLQSGSVAQEHIPISGQAMKGGPVLLVWDAVQQGGRHPESGHNVVYHEFAHKLDMVDGLVDGTPPMETREQMQRWIEVCTREFAALQDRVERGKKTFLDKYGATNVAEFFAVGTEFFFDRPIDMQKKRPDLYEVLQDFYKQDTAARERRHREADRKG